MGTVTEREVFEQQGHEHPFLFAIGQCCSNENLAIVVRNNKPSTTNGFVFR